MTVLKIPIDIMDLYVTHYLLKMLAILNLAV